METGSDLRENLAADHKNIPMNKDIEQLLRITLFKIMLKDYTIAVLINDIESRDRYYNDMVNELYLIMKGE